MLSTLLVGLLSGVGLSAPPPVVDKYDAAAYMGRWYQIADYQQFYELTCEHCTTANYTILSATTIDVLNSCRKRSVTGPLDTIHGKAYIVDPAVPAKLKVQFFESFNASYWIMKLGPIEAGLYSYSLVSDGLRESCYILSRTPTMSNSTLTEVKSFLTQHEFDVNKLFYTAQVGCPHSNN